MRRLKRSAAAVLACALALCLLVGCGGASSKVTKAQLISALNTARGNSLEEDDTLSQLAEKELESYISQEVKGETDQNDRDAVREQINSAVEEQGMTMVAFESGTRSSSGNWGFSSEAISGTADYIGCAIKEEGGAVYYAALIARDKVSFVKIVEGEINDYGSDAKLDSSLTAKAEYAAAKWEELMSGEPQTFASKEEKLSYYGLDPQTELLEYVDDDTDVEMAKNIASKVNGAGGKTYGYAKATVNSKAVVLIVIRTA